MIIILVSYYQDCYDENDNINDSASHNNDKNNIIRIIMKIIIMTINYKKTDK